MFAQLHCASSRLLAPARLPHVTRLRFSNSAVVAARGAPRGLARQDDDDDDNLSFRRSPRALQNIGEGEDEMWEYDAEGKEEGEGEGDSGAGRGSKKYTSDFARFKAEVAPRYLHAQPRNWLDPARPFPLNPSFKPPTPLSDAFRTQLYRSYMIDPETNSVRALASRHQLSIKRMDAILRLKGMEATWKQGHTLQTGFQAGMENLLGVQYERPAEGEEPQHEKHARDADQQADIEKARQRYQRLFWETVDEGKEPVMPGILAAVQANSAGAKLRGKTTLVERGPGRPAIKFIDVGDAFVDQQDKARREREGARRSVLKARKREQKQQAQPLRA